MNDNQKKELLKISVSALLLIIAILIEKTAAEEYRFALFLPSYIIIGGEVFLKAVRNIKKRQFFDENLLMLIASVAAFVIKEYPEAVAVMLFYAVGTLFESTAVDKSRKSVTELMDICPDFADIELDGELKRVDPELVEVGQIITVLPGDRVPLDGIVVDGQSEGDFSALTGESMPVHLKKGDYVPSGCINSEAVLKIKVTKPYEDSAASRILELVEDAAANKAKHESFITKFASVYTPAVTMLALLIAVIPPFFGADIKKQIASACVFLVVSCPCALVISVPLAFFAAVGSASKRGILIKGGTFIEIAARAKAVAFDKTGTLTKGEFAVVNINSEKEDTLLEIAAKAESFSTHPIALSILKAYGKTPELENVTDARVIKGKGVFVNIDNRPAYVGNAALMSENGVSVSDEGLTAVHVLYDGKYMGYLSVADAPKENAKQTVAELKKNGIRCVMLTGDSEATAAHMAKELETDEYHAALLPEDKVKYIEKLSSKDNAVIFVGDGINDAPVLTRADLGAAMGAIGSDAAIEAADCVITDDNISKISELISLSKRTLSIVRVNIVFALTIKLLVLIAGSFGIANMWLAVFSDVGVSIIAILNSMRLIKG